MNIKKTIISSGITFAALGTMFASSAFAGGYDYGNYRPSYMNYEKNQQFNYEQAYYQKVNYSNNVDYSSYRPQKFYGGHNNDYGHKMFYNQKDYGQHNKFHYGGYNRDNCDN